MSKKLPRRIQIRRGTSSEWASKNPVLLEGELGYETDTGKLKIGDGSTPWNDLPYLQTGEGGGSGGATAFTELADTPSSYTGQAGKLVGVRSTEDGLEFVDPPPTPESDQKDLKVSSNDASPGFLQEKLVAGSNITIEVLNEGGNEQLQISSTASGGGGSGPAGNDKEIQFNKAGNFGSSPNLTYDYNGGGLQVKDEMTVKRIWFYDRQDPSKPAKAFVAMRPAQYRRVIFYGEPDSGDTFGFICAPSKADKTYNSFFGFWNADFDQGPPSGAAYGGVLMQPDGSLKFFSSNNRVYFAPENKEGVYFVESGGKAAVGINNSSPSEMLTVGTAGDGSRAIANEWATFSDGRLKEVVGTIEDALSVVEQLEPVLFRWKKDKRVKAGFIAQDVAKVWKYATSGSNGLACIEPIGLLALLVQAVKELKARVEQLEEEVRNGSQKEG